jgi:hypothetical protein
MMMKRKDIENSLSDLRQLSKTTGYCDMAVVMVSKYINDTIDDWEAGKKSDSSSGLVSGDGGGKGGPQNVGVVNAAVELIKFTKSHEYPEEHTKEWMTFTQLLDSLETELRRAGIVNNKIFGG